MEIDTDKKKAIKKDLMKNSKGELAERLAFAYQSLEKAEKALVETKLEGVREFLGKARSFKCKSSASSCNYCHDDTLCSLQRVLGSRSVDEVIKMVEGGCRN